MSDLSENQKPDQGHCLIWGWLSLLIVLLDLGSKQLAVNYLQYGDPNPVIPFFDLTLLFNTGAAFSFLSEAGGGGNVGFLC